MSEFVKVINYNKTIKGNTVLQDINLSFFKGKIYGLKGRNGSGKSMLMRAICGLIHPDNGQVIVDGLNITTNRCIPGDIGAIIDNVGFINYLDGFSNLKMLAGIKNKIDDKTIKDYMIKFGLNPNEKKPVKKYSLGMRQKLGIIQAIMEDPNLILLDEATNGLDEASVQIYNSTLLELRNKQKTIIITNHNYDELHKVCDYIIEIDNGKIINVI